MSVREFMTRMHEQIEADPSRSRRLQTGRIGLAALCGIWAVLAFVVTGVRVGRGDATLAWYDVGTITGPLFMTAVAAVAVVGVVRRSSLWTLGALALGAALGSLQGVID